jgi:L-rhamnose mutarotase
VERLCFTFEVRPGAEAEYEKRHDEVWPELADAITGAGCANYSLFRRGTTITAYVECHPDVATSLGKLLSSEVNARWSESFKDIVVSVTDDEGNLYRADEVWHLD